MKITPTRLRDVLLIEPAIFEDARGFLMEAYRADRFADAGITVPFVQDNVSRSSRGVLRGLHFQEPHGQGKLIQVLAGAVFDVAVDIRRASPDFGRWTGAELSAENHQQLYIPPGFAHGFVVLSDDAIVHYKCTSRFHPESERAIRWNDPWIAIEWPITNVIISPKDAAAPVLAEVPADRLPRFQTSADG